MQTIRFHFRPDNNVLQDKAMAESLYGPLRFISPFLLTGKRVLQETCKQGTSWDDPLPSELRPMWNNYNSNLDNIEKIIISHCYVPKDFDQIVKTELHGFSDTSLYSYYHCSYLRHVNKDDKVHCALQQRPELLLLR